MLLVDGRLLAPVPASHSRDYGWTRFRDSPRRRTNGLRQLVLRRQTCSSLGKSRAAAFSRSPWPLQSGYYYSPSRLSGRHHRNDTSSPATEKDRSSSCAPVSSSGGRRGRTHPFRSKRERSKQKASLVLFFFLDSRPEERLILIPQQANSPEVVGNNKSGDTMTSIRYRTQFTLAPWATHFGR